MTQQRRPQDDGYVSPAIGLARVATDLEEADEVTTGRTSRIMLDIVPEGGEEEQEETSHPGN